MRVLYLTWGETPRPYGVYKSQVCDLLSEISSQGVEVHLLSAVPRINSSLTRERDIKGRLWKDIQSQYPDINPRQIFTAAPQPLQRIMIANIALWAPFIGQINKLMEAFTSVEPNIIHCRSYLATFAAIEARKRLGSDVKIVFDMRGFYPEEFLKQKGYSYYPEFFQKLKKFEEYILKNCDAVAVLNKEMHAAVTNVPDRKKSIHFPPVTSTAAPMNQHSDNNSHQYLFVGAIGDKIWHTQKNLCEQFESILKRDSKASLVIATHSPQQSYQSVLDKFADRVTITSFTTIEGRSEIFRKSCGGLLPYTDKSSGPAKKIGETLLGTKTVEYLCEGLQVIAHPGCLAAASLIREYDVGIVCKSDLTISSGTDLRVLTTIEQRNRIKAVGKNLFSVKNVARSYTRLYDSLI